MSSSEPKVNYLHPHDNNHNINISYVNYGDLSDDEVKVFKDALFKSKGKSNNRLGAMLAYVGADSDTIADYASRVKGSEVMYKSPERKLDEFDRQMEQVLRSIPDFWETTKGKALKATKAKALKMLGVDIDKPLPISKIDRKRSRFYFDRATGYTGGRSVYHHELSKVGYSLDYERPILFATTFSALADVEFKESLEGLMKRSQIDTLDQVNTPGYKTFFDYEVDSFSHMDNEITKEIDPVELCSDVIANEFQRIFSFSGSAYVIETQCLIEAFYEVCKEMGIAGIIDGAVNGRTYVSQSALRGIMKNVIKLSGTYRRLVKSGFAESVARETVVAEINESIAKRATRPCLRFYPRNDYKDTPEEEREKTKKVSQSHPRAARRVMTLEEFKAKINKEKEEKEKENG